MHVCRIRRMNPYFIRITATQGVEILRFSQRRKVLVDETTSAEPDTLTCIARVPKAEKQEIKGNVWRGQ